MKTDKVKIMTRTAILLAITIIIQFINMPQLITGSIVNAILVLAGGLMGIWSGVTIGLLTPIIAFLFGIMKMPVMIPFIIIGNALYVIIGFINKKYYRINIFIAAVVKFLWLAASVKYILGLFNINVPKPIVQMFTLPQLITAVAGAIVGLLFVELLKKRVK